MNCVLFIDRKVTVQIVPIFMNLMNKFYRFLVIFEYTHIFSILLIFSIFKILYISHQDLFLVLH